MQSYLQTFWVVSREELPVVQGVVFMNGCKHGVLGDKTVVRTGSQTSPLSSLHGPGGPDDTKDRGVPASSRFTCFKYAESQERTKVSPVKSHNRVFHSNLIRQHCVQDSGGSAGRPGREGGEFSGPEQQVPCPKERPRANCCLANPREPRLLPESSAS